MVLELFTLMLFKHQDSDLMKCKILRIFNRPDENGVGFGTRFLLLWNRCSSLMTMKSPLRSTR
jgi:hypothetical protein